MLPDTPSPLLLLIFYCLNDPALRYSLLQSNLALPRYETRALAVPRRRPAHLAGDGESLCILIFLSSSGTPNFAAPRLWVIDTWQELTCFCYSQGKARGRAMRSWTWCCFAAGGDGWEGEDGVFMVLSPSPGSNRSGWALWGLGRHRIGNGMVTELLCHVRGLLQCSFIFIASLEPAQDQRG